MPDSANKIEALLFSLGLCTPESIEPFFARTRDVEDLPVLRCRKSGIIYLARTAHMSVAHYQAKDTFKFVAPEWNRPQSVVAAAEDTARRSAAIRSLIANKRWLDFGTGPGAILEALRGMAMEMCGCEPQDRARRDLEHLDCPIYAALSEVPRGHFDAITLFHVLEHLDEPVATLRELRACLAPGGRIFVEVPHARDFLLSVLDLDDFKRFTLWSEHLMLHTRESLRRFLEEAGYSDVLIEGVQRYPLANHLHWLSKRKAGGHLKWPHLRSPELDRAYAAQLGALDLTDTLVAHATA